MLLAAGHSWRPDAGFARWGIALGVILLLHAGAALGSMIAWESADPPAPPPAAIVLELAPLPAAPPAPLTAAPPEPQSEPPPEPEPPVDLSRLLPPIPELPLTPPDIPPPDVELPKPKPKPEKRQAETPKSDQTAKKPKEKEVVQKPKPTPAPDAEPTVAPKPAPQRAEQQAALAAPARQSVMPAAPSAAEVARRLTAEANWQGLLLAHLERHKKYPRLARKRQEEGTAHLRFRMDRSGQVLSFALARSAGYEALDEEVLAMIERAQPLPALPPEVTESELEVVVPVQFTLR